MTSQAVQFSGTVRRDGDRVLVMLAGGIDISTVSQFSDLMDQAVAFGARRVTVDVAGIDFLDAQAFHILVITSERLRMAGAKLDVRAATPRLYRLFQITDLLEALGVEQPRPHPALVGMVAALSTIPATRDVLDAALKLVVTMAQAVVSGADGVSITLPRQGQLGTVAASNDVVLEMDHDQYDTGQGPCLDAATEGERFFIDELNAEVRWPAFVPRAQARGIKSILSTPLVSAGTPVGALNVYSRTAGAFAVHEKQWTDQFAAEASLVVAAAHLGESVPPLQEQVNQALLSRESIALAQGVVMQRDGVAAEAAHRTLRNHSRRTGTPLRLVAEELVAGHRHATTPASGDTSPRV